MDLQAQDNDDGYHMNKAKIRKFMKVFVQDLRVRCAF